MRKAFVFILLFVGCGKTSNFSSHAGNAEITQAPNDLDSVNNEVFEKTPEKISISKKTPEAQLPVHEEDNLAAEVPIAAESIVEMSIEAFPSFDLDDNLAASKNICESTMGFRFNNTTRNCEFSTSQIFGGSYQHNQTKNSFTGRIKACPAGFEKTRVMHTNNAFGEQLYIYMCWKKSQHFEQKPVVGCELGETKILAENGKEVCSSIPVQICQSFDGNFDGQTGRCHVPSEKSVYGGHFETGEAEVVKDAHIRFYNFESKSYVTEKCETPNATTGRCVCPTGFTPQYGSAVIEGTNMFDRLNFCLGPNKQSLRDNLSSKMDDCEPGHMKSTWDGKKMCSPEVVNFCKRVGGFFNANSRKCQMSSEDFFGGMFQLGERKDLGKSQVDPTKYCESPNPITGQCSCPKGYSHHIIFNVAESPSPNYDEQYMCVRD